jgi:hypothetical protein
MEEQILLIEEIKQRYEYEIRSIDRKYNEECRLHYNDLERKIVILSDVIKSLEELRNTQEDGMSF